MTCRLALKQSETDIQSSILEMLKWHPLVAFANRRNTGGVHRNGRYIEYNKPGTLDIDGMLKGGRRFEIEVKKKKGKPPTEKQQERIDEVCGYGGIAGSARTIQEARDIVER